MASLLITSQLSSGGDMSAPAGNGRGDGERAAPDESESVPGRRARHVHRQRRLRLRPGAALRGHRRGTPRRLCHLGCAGKDIVVQQDDNPRMI